MAHEDSPDKISMLETIATQKGARTMELDEHGHRVFLVTAEFGPTPTAERPRPPMVPGSFTLLVLGR